MIVFLTALCACIAMFTAIPMPRMEWNEELAPLRTACLPLAGLLIGGLWLGLAALAQWLLPAALSAAVIAAAPILLSGCMHMDGFMDTADALMSWRDRDEKMKILKDVHVGSFSVILLAIALMLQFAACMTVDKLLPLLFIPVLSRCGSAICVLRLPKLGHSEYADMKSKANLSLSYIVLGVAGAALILMLIFGGWRALLVGCAALVGYALAMWRCVRSLGGISGDLAGFSLVVAELCGLIVLAVV